MRSQGSLIVQVSDTPWVDIRDRLELLSSEGVTHIQISPVQGTPSKLNAHVLGHCQHTSAWYRVYQPTGTSISNSLGSKNELEELVRDARKFGIGIVVDVVLHHRTGCPLCNPWVVFSLPSLLKEWLRCTMEAYNLKEKTGTRRFGCIDWGPPQDFENGSVVGEATKFLTELLKIGVSGFRFDAAKHIKPEFVRDITLNAIRDSGIADPSYLLNYSEVMDHQPWICEEYLLSDHPLLTVTDYPRTFNLLGCFKPGGDLRHVVEDKSWWSWKSICLADSHDSQEGHSYAFFDRREGALAAGLLLAIGCGTPMIYHEFLNDDIVRAGIRFYHLAFGHDSVCSSLSTNELLILHRGDAAFAILNKSNDWIRWDTFLVEGAKEGRYKEMRYNFEASIQRGSDGKNWVSSWGGDGGGMKIGPRDILYFIFI